MGMNLVHGLCCSSNYWARTVEDKLLPWVLRDVELGEHTLEIGPGYGANLRALVDRTELTAVEIDKSLADRLIGKYGERARIIQGDGTDLQLPDAEFSSVVCFTMLHHVPSAALQDRLLAEVARVLRPGGIFAGRDSRYSLRFRLLHVLDTMTLVDPATFSGRLRSAGFSSVQVDANVESFRFRARRL